MSDPSQPSVERLLLDLLRVHPARRRIEKALGEGRRPDESLAEALFRLGYLPGSRLRFLEAAAQGWTDTTVKVRLLRSEPAPPGEAELRQARRERAQASEEVSRFDEKTGRFRSVAPPESEAFASSLADKDESPGETGRFHVEPSGDGEERLISAEGEEPAEETQGRVPLELGYDGDGREGAALEGVEEPFGPAFSNSRALGERDTLARLDQISTGAFCRPLASPAPGCRLQNYMLERKVGEGASSEVWKAFDEDLRLDVALKLLKRDPEAQRFADSFLQEARRAARLTHPNILRVYRCGTLGPGLLFIAAEFVDGEAVGTLLRRGGPLEPAQALEIGLLVASALDFAAAEGLLHRDVKPRNIMLSALGPLKLIDFGLCEAIESPCGDGPLLAGTPAYMAPELVGGAAGANCQPSVRSDIYALGVSLFEMLAGRLPFEAETVSDMLDLQVSQAAPVLSEVAPGLKRFDRLIGRMLAKDPEARPRSHRAVWKMLIDAWRRERGHSPNTKATWRRGLVTPETAAALRSFADPEPISSPNFEL